MTENRNFTAATINEVIEILTGKTIKRVEAAPAIGKQGFTIVCAGEEGADGAIVSVCETSPDGADFHVSVL